MDDGYGRAVYSILENDNQSVPFYLSSCTPKHETLENYSTSFLYQILWLFCFYFLILFLLLLHPYVCETPRPFNHPLTRCPENGKNRVEGRVEHATRDVRVYLILEKSNACSLLLLPLHVRCFLSAAAWLLWRTIAK